MDINCSLDKKKLQILHQKSLVALVTQLLRPELEQAQSTKVVDFEARARKHGALHTDFHRVYFSNDPQARAGSKQPVQPALFRPRSQSSLKINHVFKGAPRSLPANSRHGFAAIEHAATAQRVSERLEGV